MKNLKKMEIGFREYRNIYHFSVVYFNILITLFLLTWQAMNYFISTFSFQTVYISKVVSQTVQHYTDLQEPGGWHLPEFVRRVAAARGQELCFTVRKFNCYMAQSIVCFLCTRSGNINRLKWPQVRSTGKSATQSPNQFGLSFCIRPAILMLFLTLTCHCYSPARADPGSSEGGGQMHIRFAWGWGPQNLTYP